MNKLKVIVVDDERPAREFLKSLLQESGKTNLVGEAENGTDAVDLIKSTKPDLAFLDLNMPEMSGLDVIHSLSKNEVPLAAFVTAHDEFAVEAFELNAVDYLLKPVEKERLLKTLERAAERLERSDWRSVEVENIENAMSMYDNAATKGPLLRIPVKVREDIVLVSVSEISSIVADGEILHIQTASRQRYNINYRLKDLESRLDPAQFIRLSRSSLVNLDHVKSISPMPGGTYIVILSNGAEIASSRFQSKLLRSKLLKL